MSTKRKQTIQEIVEGLGRTNRAAMLFAKSIAESTGLNHSDSGTLEFLFKNKIATAGQLSKISGLTTGATTAMINRLEKEKLVKRSYDAKDRRKVLIALTPKAKALPRIFDAPFAKVHTLLVKEMEANYTDKEIELLKEWNDKVEQVYLKQLAQKK